MSEMKHTPEPWSIGTCMSGESCWCRIIKPDVVSDGAISKVDAERACLCVNACKGLSNESLESGVVQELVEACRIAHDNQNQF
jgi:hypothetical protein